MSRDSSVGLLIAVAAAGLIVPATLHGQARSFGITPAFAYATAYPDRFRDVCADVVGVVPSIHGHYRVGRFLTTELGISSQFQVQSGPTHTCPALPPLDGELRPRYDISRGSVSVAAEGRLVFTPLSNAGGSLRVIGGGAWYLNRGTPAWIVGAGFRPLTSWGAVVVDVERWGVGFPYDIERVRLGQAGEIVGSGRAWQRLWQFRLGVTVWSR